MGETVEIPAPPSQPAAATMTAAPEPRFTNPTTAMDLVRTASIKIRRYESAFAGLAREIAAAFDRMKSENAYLRANIAELEARAAEAEERARKAISGLHDSHNYCLQLRHQVRDLEVALEAAETHIQKSTGYISRLGAYILRSHAGNDDRPPRAVAVPPAAVSKTVAAPKATVAPAAEGATARQVEAILRRRAG